MLFGVISDTHGYLHPNVKLRFKNVDQILHAGDVGDLKILYSLEGIANTEAVYGNMDDRIVQDETRFKQVIKAGNVTIGLAHGGGSPRDIIQRLREMFRSDNVDVIVFGHTHNPEETEYDGVFFFNPGYGRRTVGFLEVNEDGSFTTKIERL